MDLSNLLGKTFDLLKANLVLFLPPLVTSYLVPTILGVVALLVFVPILVVAPNYPNFFNSLMIGAIIGGTVIVVAAVTLWIGIIAGQANMNKKAVLKGKTSLADFNEGVRKYFARILGGHILILLIFVFLAIYIVLIFTGLGLDFTAVPPTIQDMIKKLSEANWSISAVPVAVWLEFLKLMSKLIGAVFGLVALGFLVYLFTLTWVQACVIEEVGVLKAIRMSCGFVARNFYTAIGYLGLFVIANGFTSSIFPGGGGGGGWGGGGFGFGIPAPLAAVFNLLITTFFTLLLYVMYADRTGKLITAKPPSPPSIVFRTVKKE